jgi:hypothetical protein
VLFVVVAAKALSLEPADFVVLRGVGALVSRGEEEAGRILFMVIILLSKGWSCQYVKLKYYFRNNIKL